MGKTIQDCDLIALRLSASRFSSPSLSDPQKHLFKCLSHNFSNQHAENNLKEELLNFLGGPNTSFLLSPVKADFTKVLLPRFNPRHDKLREYSEAFNKLGYWTFGFCNDPTTGEDVSVESYDLFQNGIKEICRFVEGKSIQNEKSKPAFSALGRFFMEKDKHEYSLKKVLGDKYSEDGGKVAKVLVNHLLSQLLPVPSNHYLDNKYNSDGCSCGSESCINYGSTHIGSPSLFYGRADLVMSPHGKGILDMDFDIGEALFTLNLKDRMPNDDHSLLHCGLDILEDEHGSIDADLKHIKLENSDSFYSCDDGLYIGELDKHKNITNFNSLYSDHGIKHVSTEIGPFYHLCKLAIASSLYRKRIGGGSGKPLFVPAFQMSDTSFNMALYDPDKDFLLRNLEPMPLFETDLSLSLSAIIHLWLAVHYGKFATEITDKYVTDLLHGTGNLKGVLGEDLFNAVVRSSGLITVPVEEELSVDIPNKSSTKVLNQKAYEAVFEKYVDMLKRKNPGQKNHNQNTI